LQLFQLYNKILSHDIRAGTDHLTQLDEGGPQFFEGQAQSLGGGQVGELMVAVQELLFNVDIFPDAQLAEKFTEAVLGQYTHYLAVALKVL
jgi:hypothetical protein